MGKRERGIQSRTVTLLCQKFWRIVVRVKHGTPFAVAGDPDIYGCVSSRRIRGRMFAFEVKNEDGQLTKIQTHRLKEFEAAGAITGAIREPEDAVWFINEALTHGS